MGTAAGDGGSFSLPLFPSVLRRPVQQQKDVLQLQILGPTLAVSHVVQAIAPCSLASRFLAYRRIFGKLVPAEVPPKLTERRKQILSGLLILSAP